MATLGEQYVTLTDLRNRIDPSGALDDIIERAADNHHFIQDALVLEGNMDSGNKATVRTGYPEGTWRKLYQGVANEKSTTKQVVDSVGMLESFSEIDSKLVRMAPDSAKFRAGEDMAFLEGLMQTIETTFFYGDTDIDPEKFMGMSARYDSVSGAENSENVFDAAGTDTANEQSSIWLITWDPKTCFTFFGKGSNAGFSMKNLGEERVYDGSDNGYMAMVTHFMWELGLAVPDWRYSGRICNIDTVNRAAGTFNSLRDSLIDLVNIKPDDRGRSVLYMNKANRTAIRKMSSQTEATTAVHNSLNLTIEDYFGKNTMHIDGIPIRLADTLTDTEAEVT
jgi:hypothetical protein